MATVLLSIFAHGLSAPRSIDRYAATLPAGDPGMREGVSGPP